MDPIAEIRQKSVEDIKGKIKELKEDLSKKRHDILLGKETKTAEILKIRRQIARFSTALREKEILSTLDSTN